MKQFILIALTLMLFGCEEPKQVYETDIKTYVISQMYSEDQFRGPTYYCMYFQTRTSTECASVSAETYKKYKVGDTIQVLIKYWEKPKKK
jgi:hypothetical protein